MPVSKHSFHTPSLLRRVCAVSQLLYFAFADLLEVVNNYLMESVSPSTCLYLRDVSKLFSLETLQEKTEKCIFENFEEVTSQERFCDLNESDVSLLLSSDELKVCKLIRVGLSPKLLKRRDGQGVFLMLTMACCRNSSLAGICYLYYYYFRGEFCTSVKTFSCTHPLTPNTRTGHNYCFSSLRYGPTGS